MHIAAVSEAPDARSAHGGGTGSAEGRVHGRAGALGSSAR